MNGEVSMTRFACDNGGTTKAPGAAFDRYLEERFPDSESRGALESRVRAVSPAQVIASTDYRSEQEARVVEAYARGYGAHPQEKWIGEAGLRLGGRLLKDEPRI